MIKWASLLSIIITFFFFSFSIQAKVMKIKVSKHQVVTQEVKITPGFAVMFEVPSEIFSISIADQTSFTCAKLPPDNHKILCKPLTIKPFSTNLILTTETNEFNIILKIDEVGKDHPFKYVFYDSSSVNRAYLSKRQNDSITKSAPSNLMDQLLNDFVYEKCSHKASNAYADLRCVEKFQIGTDRYLRFQIASKSKAVFNIVTCQIVVQTLGGFTGLVLKSESPIQTEQIIKSKNLRFGEETYGIVKIPKVSVGKDQRMVLSVFTDIGKEEDLILNHL